MLTLEGEEPISVQLTEPRVATASKIKARDLDIVTHFVSNNLNLDTQGGFADPERNALEDTMLMETSQTWTIVKRPAGQCEIVPNAGNLDGEVVEKWGPFDSKTEAIARRVGLIRSGKCEPLREIKN